MTRETAEAAASARPRRRRIPARRVALLFAVVAAAVVAVDQVTKVVAVQTFVSAPVDLGFVRLVLHRNPNGAFSIPGFPGMFVAVTVIVLALVIRVLPRTGSAAMGLAYGLVVGGALGNALDRVFRAPGFPVGAVVDWIQLGGFMSWFPVFNAADSAITVGAGLLFVLLSRQEREERRAAEAALAAPSVRPETRPPRVERRPAGDEQA